MLYYHRYLTRRRDVTQKSQLRIFSPPGSLNRLRMPVAFQLVHDLIVNFHIFHVNSLSLTALEETSEPEKYGLGGLDPPKPYFSVISPPPFLGGGAGVGDL